MVASSSQAQNKEESTLQGKETAMEVTEWHCFIPELIRNWKRDKRKRKSNKPQLLRLWGEGYSIGHLQRACTLFFCRNS